LSHSGAVAIMLPNVATSISTIFSKIGSVMSVAALEPSSC
jgi:Flp pilus assembly pilin Flp